VTTLYLDLETYSPINLKKAGSYRYAEDVEILLLAWAWGPEAVQVAERPGPGIVFDILNRFDAPRVVAHNSMFDRRILENLDFVPKGMHWDDTMIRAHAHSMPGGLQFLSGLYRLAEGKKKEGRELIQLFCKPQKDDRRFTKQTHPKEWASFVEYARCDIAAMRTLDGLLPRFNDTPAEHEIWELDQRINDRGFMIDVPYVKKITEVLGQEKVRKDLRILDKTQGVIGSASQGQALVKHIADTYGIVFPDMRKSTVERRINDPELSEDVKELLRMRLLGSGTAVSKYQTMLEMVGEGDRIRGTLAFDGAIRTGRWAGRGVQPHNFPRPSHKYDEITQFITAAKIDAADLLYDDTASLATSALRSTIIAPEGKKLVVADYSSIEGRVLAWLAGEAYKIRAYQEIDQGIGYDMYIRTYASTFGVKPEDVTKEQRQLGKVLELALGYGGGVGAFVTFAAGYGIDLQELADSMHATLAKKIRPHVIRNSVDLYEWAVKRGRTYDLSKRAYVVCDLIKQLWRDANPATVKFWSDLETAARNTILTASEMHLDRVSLRKDKQWLLIQLPSGRYLCYPGAKTEGGKIQYRGLNQYTKQWGDIGTYGGKLCENVTQAVARDVLCEGMLRAEKAGFEIVLTVHDEVVSEAGERERDSVEFLVELMTKNPTWAEGLPLAAAGYESYRYRKG